MELPELLALVNSKSASAALPVAASNNAFYYPREHLREFVAPTMRPKEGSPAGSKVVVISAAGAVGKTTLAREVAFRSGAPYWDLSEQGPVGQHSLIGALGVTFGTSALPKLTQQLQAGGLCVVVDAFDEARVKVTESGFEAFVNDIAALSATASGLAFVLFSRTQIAESIWLLLQDAGVQTCLLEIEHLQESLKPTIRK
jgi:hypothetical protein